MTVFSIYSTNSLDSVEKKYKSGDYLKGTKQRNLSCRVCVRWYVGKTVLKAKQQIGKLLYI